MRKVSLLSILVVVLGMSFEASAQLGINNSGNKSAGANMMGAVVNIGVGAGLASGSWAICAYQATKSLGGDTWEWNDVMNNTMSHAGSVPEMMVPSFGSNCPPPPDPQVVRTVSMAVSFMSVMEYAQGAMNVMSVAQSKKTADSAAYGAGGAYGAGQFGDINFPDGSTMTGNQLGQNLANLSDAMKKNGMGLDVASGKITMPNGNTVDAATMNSGDAGKIASAMGLPKDAVEKALALTKKATQDQLSKYKNYDLKMAGGGGGSSGISSGDRNPSGLGLDFSKLFGKKHVEHPQVSGLTKVVNGNPVGVAQDDIFQMVQRRYQEKDRSDFFSK